MARALEKVSKGGLGYSRPPEIEAGISEALEQSPEELVRRSRIINKSDAGYMSSECLVHLVRAARLNGDRRLLDKLLPPLLTRCEHRLKITIPSNLPDAQGLRDEVLQRFCELIARAGTDQDATGLDIFECRFNKGLEYLRFKTLRRETNHAKRFRDLNDVCDDDGNSVDPDALMARLSRAARTPANQEDFVFLQQVLKAIETLPEAQRKAIQLCGLQGYQPASEDPDEITAATICGISGTAVRKNLRKAIAKLNNRKET